MPVPDTSHVKVRFAGYAAVFDLLDHGGDIVKPGAFRRSLAGGRTIPLLWQHRTGTVIGRIERIEEDRRGLRVIGSINCSESGANAARLISSRRIDGLSFGYRVQSSEQSEGARLLKDVDLLEVSVVTRPMQPKARIHAVQES
ncbi:HK97 family phage prohead protease [Sphingomonas sp. KRR8]|uniref:HK97 family phage prohead protease n=1 Tax=Sphingomonas sp. KRR8 TaxID=2942996 RepID=UPI0020216AE4|nr:HK97 family phage prohead protease [Sphingomonas sp. KRR8]URD62219.1 HK97 family phage prohead protease [Sphingomonas sp. KRR8]